MREIILIYVLCIDSIRVLYDKNGMPVLSEKHGGPGGHTNAEVGYFCCTQREAH